MTKLTRIACYAAPLLAALIASPAAAEDLGGGFAVNGGATVVSDYRFRGISQTDKRFAIQGTISVSHSSGFYATVWGSSIDDYVANGADAELDLIIGYKKTFGSTTIDGGVLYYYYPGSGGDRFRFRRALHYRSATSPGRSRSRAPAAYAPKQKALTIGDGKEDNFYLAGDLSFAIPNTPVGLTGPPRPQLRAELPDDRRRIYRLEPRRDGHAQEPDGRPVLRRHRTSRSTARRPQHRQGRDRRVARRSILIGGG